MVGVPQLSVPVAVPIWASVNVLVQIPVARVNDWLAGQVMIGAVASLTVTSNSQTEENMPSDAVHLICVVPKGNITPFKVLATRGPMFVAPLN